MKLKTMLFGLTLMLGCFVLASCINDEEGPCLPDGKTQVIFSLVLPDNAQTRAEATNWVEGEGIDNDIDLSSIKLLIYDATGACKGVMTSHDLNYIPRQTGTTPYEKTVYDCIGTVPTTIVENLVKNTEYRFVVLANCTAAINNPSWSELSAVTFPRTQESMPMWGVQSGTLSLNKGESMSLGNIVLLRAKAKVTVALDDTSDATTSDVDKMDGFTYISSIEVKNFTDNGFIVPEVGAAVKATPANVEVAREECTEKSTGVFKVEGNTTKEITFYLLEYKNSTAAESDQAQLIVTLGKTVEGKEETKSFDFAPIKFCTYENGAPSGAPFDIVRNHYYKFNITEVVGGLYVVPTVADWIDGSSITYTIKMSTNMRLFDSWLYRYDTDNDYGNWNDSYMVVSSGKETEAPVTGSVAGRPLRSPQIQLVTTGTGSNTFELYVDNSDFEIIRANKNEVGVVISYEASTDGKLTIPAGENVYTYFYITPKEGTTPSEPKAHVFLYYNDNVTGKQEVTYNYSSLPGYSDDSSEIWVYYVSEAAYDAGQIDDANKFMKMYYQDAGHPLVPVQP